MQKDLQRSHKAGSRLEKPLHLLLAVIIFFGFFSILDQKEWEGYAVKQYGGTAGYVEDTWTFSQGGEVLEPEIRLPAFLPLEADQDYEISTTLTYDGQKDPVPYCFFYIHHMYCRAYLQGEEVFSYMEEDIEKRDNARSPGNVYVSFPLPKDCQGMELSITFRPTLTMPMDYELPYAQFGDYPTMIRDRFLADVPHNTVTMLAAFLGLAAILFSTLTLRGSDYREGIFIGLFALMFSIYNVTESRFNLYLISNPYFTYLVNYTTFTLIPVTMLAFLREKMQGRAKWICSALVGLGVLMTVLEGMFHFTGICDMRGFLPFIHCYFGAAMLISFLTVITMPRGRDKKWIIVQLVPVGLGMSLDGLIYYRHWEIGTTDATFSSIGVIVFLVIELCQVWRSSLEIYAASIRSQQYQEMAYVDKLTGAGNRRAFDAEKLSVITGKQKYRSMVIVSADVNDLKQVNDTQGHTAGDELIKGTARVLSRMAEGVGKTFRTGGDEFMCVLYDITPEELDRRLNLARDQVSAINQYSKVRLSIAMGFETVEGADIEAAIQKADRNMYINKSEEKEKRRQAQTHELS